MVRLTVCKRGEDDETAGRRGSGQGATVLARVQAKPLRGACGGLDPPCAPRPAIRVRAEGV